MPETNSNSLKNSQTKGLAIRKNDFIENIASFYKTIFVLSFRQDFLLLLYSDDPDPTSTTWIRPENERNIIVKSERLVEISLKIKQSFETCLVKDSF